MDKKLLRKEMRSFRNSIDFTREKNCKIRKKVLELFEEENIYEKRSRYERNNICSFE